MKHKHYEMIVAKAANTELIQLYKANSNWHETNEQFNRNNGWAFYEDAEYFLCLPQHKEACLHWLNGGDIEAQMREAGVKLEYMTGNPNKEWSNKTVFMSGECDIRIKQKKEKRLIGIGRNGFTTAHYAEADRCLLEETIKNLCPDAVIHEIEVEV